MKRVGLPAYHIKGEHLMDGRSGVILVFGGAGYVGSDLVNEL